MKCYLLYVVIIQIGNRPITGDRYALQIFKAPHPYKTNTITPKPFLPVHPPVRPRSRINTLLNHRSPACVPTTRSRILLLCTHNCEYLAYPLSINLYTHSRALSPTIFPITSTRLQSLILQYSCN